MMQTECLITSETESFQRGHKIDARSAYFIGGEKDFVVSFLKNQNKTLSDVTKGLEDGAGFDESIPHTLKRVEKDIRWLRKFYLNKKGKGEHFMWKVLSVILAGFMVLTLCPASYATSTQVDSLIEKLVDKGILTKAEGIELKGEIAADEKILREEGFKQSLPPWVQDMKWKGDLRVRYQNERRDSTNSRNRGRIRFRLGMETKANEKVKVAVGVATGSGDPRSTNETLENSFEKSDIRLDYAYAQYLAIEWVSLMAGKVVSPFWVPKDLIFDSDITYDGASANFVKKLNDKWEVFFNTGFFILDENATENYDPYMYVAQPGLKVKTSPKTSLKVAGAYYGIDSIKDGSKLAHSSGTNTGLTSTGGTYSHNYDPIGMGMEFAMANPCEKLTKFGVDELAFFSEYVKNTSGDEHDQGFLAGARIGAKKVAGPKQWQLSYNFRRLERNAILDIFPDSDFYGGGTHVQGHEAALSYGLGKNVSLDLDYYRAAPIGGEEVDTRQAKVENLIQTDLNFKF